MKQQSTRAVRKKVARLRVAQPPEPWRQTADSAVGGLQEVGFGPGSDCLLVVSSQGRGVVDCSTGERVARDPGALSSSWYSEVELKADGIGPLSGVAVRLSGLHGGGLPKVTEDGWWVEDLALDWPEHHLLLGGPGTWLFDEASKISKLAVERELRTFGFSETGRSLVLATSSDVTVWHRG